MTRQWVYALKAVGVVFLGVGVEVFLISQGGAAIGW